MSLENITLAFGMESIDPAKNVLDSAQKSFRLFRLLDKKDNYFERNMRLGIFNGVVFMPLVTNRDAIGDIVKKFFGSKGYSQFLPFYVYNKKFVYQPYFLAGKKNIITGREKIIRDEALMNLPKLKNVPTYKYMTNKNLIADYVDQFNMLFPTQNQLVKPTLLKYSESIFPEIITRFGISFEDQEKFKYTARYSSTQPQPYICQNHSVLLLPIEVKVLENKLVSMYLDYTKPIPLSMKKNPETIKFLSLIRFVYRCFAKDTETNDTSMKFFIEECIKRNVIFFFYNKRFSFSVNFADLHKRNFTNRQFFNMFKSKLLILISNNIGLQADESIDQMIIEDEKEDVEDPTRVTKDVTINAGKNKEPDKKIITSVSNDKVEDDSRDDSDKKFNKVLKSSLKISNTTKTLNDIKKKSKALFSAIDKLTDNKAISKIEKAFSEIDEEIQPDEDKPKPKPVVKRQPVKESLPRDVTFVQNSTSSNRIDFDDEEEETTVEEEKDLEDIIDEEASKEETVINDDTEAENFDDEESDPEHNEDIPDELLDLNRSDEKIDIRISSDGNLSEEEKKELLIEINKRQMPKKSEKQLRRIALVKDKYKSIKIENDMTVEELLNKIDSTQIESSETHVPGVLDQSVQKSNLYDFEQTYINKTMKQDIIKTFKSFGNDDKSIPLHMIDYKEEDSSDRFNHKHTITVKYEDELQKHHTIKLDIPVPDKDGTLFINGNKKILKKQIILRPLVKINPDRLAINTFYNKVLMYRQGTILNKKVILIKKFIETYLKEDTENFKVNYGNNLRNNKPFLTSIEYDELAKVYHKIMIGKKGNRTVFFLSQPEIRDEIKKLNLPYIFTVDKLPIGIDYSAKKIIEFDMKETDTSVGDYILDAFREKGGFTPEDFNEIVKSVRPPKRRIYSRVTIQSFDIPTIAFLGSLFGLRNIMKLNQLKFTFATKPLEKDAVEKNWLTIKFKDGTLYYPEYPYGNSLLFNGLAEMNTEEFNFDEYDDLLPYSEYLFNAFHNRNMYKGWIAFRELFIDDITREILSDEGLPTDFLELFLYANELLTDNSYVNETEAKSYRIRGYEILSTAIYKYIAAEYQKYKQHEGKKGTISVPQTFLYTALTKSQILENYDTINPINELKMKAGVTVKGVGVGGANVKHGYGMDRRAFGTDAVGIYAESNVDNHNIGVVKELTTNPKILNTRGYLDTTSDPEKISKLTASQRMAPEELLMPGEVKFDSPNRVAFASAQWKHTLPIYGGGDVPFVTTGYEDTLIYQIGDTYAVRAEEECKVDQINETLHIVVTVNKDGKKKTYRYGTEMERNANFYLENNMLLNVKEGQKLKKNDVIAYSKEFFQKTPGGNLTFTMGRIGKFILMDDYFTEEDSTLISEEFSKRMQTSITKKKQIRISAKSNIIKYAKIGTIVKDGDVLMTFEDQKDEELSNTDINEILDLLGSVDESSIEKLSYHAPKANASGKITDIDVLWTGEISDMSESCRKFVNEYIKRKKEKLNFEKEQTGEDNINSLEIKKSIPNFGMLNGEHVDENDLLIEYYITHVTNYSTGDKISMNNSIKSVTCQITPEEESPYSESGKIDGVMGLISLSARQVNSAYFLGAAGKILHDMCRDISSEYLGK